MSLKCNRCGKCCENLMLRYSPDYLKSEYIRWNEQKGKDFIQEIYLIYPMLKYSHYNKDNKHYIYKCIHFYRMKNKKGVCAIKDIRPIMCKDFPIYKSVAMNINRNPSQYIGCGYNLDKKEGI